jgi:hypothetical protein
VHIDGRCHCGLITYVAEVERDSVSLCHCTDCQVLCGSPWRASAVAPAATFRFTGGTPKIYVKTAESGARRAQAFCPECGTPIYAANEHDPPTYHLRLGAIVQRDQLRPWRQTWARSTLPWASDIRGVPASQKSWPPT